MSAGPSPTRMCAPTVFVAGSMRTTSAAWSPATQTDPAPVHTLYCARRADVDACADAIRIGIDPVERSGPRTVERPDGAESGGDADQARAAQPDPRRRVESQQHAEALAGDPGRAEVASERLRRPERPRRAADRARFGAGKARLGTDVEAAGAGDLLSDRDAICPGPASRQREAERDGATPAGRPAGDAHCRLVQSKPHSRAGRRAL